MNKKITSSALAALMVAGTTSFSAFAAMDPGTVVIGTKAYDLAYANNAANLAEITNAIVAGGAVYVKGFDGKWINNSTSAVVDASVIPAVSYKNATGVVSAFDAADKDVVSTLAVSAVSANTASTLTVTGTGLSKLKADAITVDGLSVTSVTASDNGLSATITLDGNLAPKSSTIVTIKDETDTKTYTVTYGFAVSSVVVNETTFDDERSNQSVTFRVNGQSQNADLDYLTLAGYSVNFVALDSNGDPAMIFDNGSGVGTNVSSTGDLLSDLRLLVDSYTIEVQVIGNTTAAVSDKGTITISNIDANVTAINSVSFVNTVDGTYDSSYNAGALAGDDYEMVSTTLVAGETAAIYNVNATVATEKLDLLIDGFTAKSSNTAVLSVVKDGSNNYILTAESAGTATITVTNGKITKSYNFTVTNTKRSLKVVKPASSKIDLVAGNAGSVSIKISTFDQYGDPIQVSSGNALGATPVVGTKVDGITEVIPNGAGGTPLVANFDVITNVADSVGVCTQVIDTNNETGSGTIYFKNSDGVVLGSLLVNTSAVNNVTKSTLTLKDTSTTSADNALDFQDADENSVKYVIAQYNSQNIFVGNADLAGYTIQVVDPTVATVSTTNVAAATSITALLGDTDFVVHAKAITTASKSSSVVVKKADGTLVGQFTITVSNVPYKISAVQFKTVPTINYVGKEIKASDVLTLTKADGDDLVSGITLNKASSSKVRIAETPFGATIAVDDLYLDLDNDGVASTGDVKLGTLVATVANGAVGITPMATGTGYVAHNMIDAATALSDKGTLIVKVMTNATDATTAIAASSVAIDVK